MNKERFLDVNGFNVEYDIPLEKRLNKYRTKPRRDSSRASISTAERLRDQSEAWRAGIRHKQAVLAIVAAVVFACVIVAACYLTFGQA